VGCPYQRQTVIVDTGSSVTAFPCTTCHDCGGVNETDPDGSFHIDHVFNETASSCFQTSPCSECILTASQSDSCIDDPADQGSSGCHVSRHYSEGSSWDAIESIDKVYTGGFHNGSDGREESFDLHFGCQTALKGLFRTQWADGIMGMKADSNSYWKQAYNAGIISSLQFSLCFTKQLNYDKEGTDAGAMILGDHDNTHLHQTPMVYAKMRLLEGAYGLQLERIYLRVSGGESIVVDKAVYPNSSIRVVGISITKLNQGDVILDSGTTATYLSTNLETPFNDQWKVLMNEKYDPHREYSEDDIDTLPTILFQMTPWAADNDPSTPGITGPDLDKFNPNSILVAFPSSHYLSYVATRGVYKAHIYFTQPTDKRQTLGANFLRGKDVLFDVGNERVGFAESHCNYFNGSSEGQVDSLPSGEETPSPTSTPTASPTLDNRDDGTSVPSEGLPPPPDFGDDDTPKNSKDPPKNSDHDTAQSFPVFSCGQSCQYGLIATGVFVLLGSTVVLLRRNSNQQHTSRYAQANAQDDGLFYETEVNGLDGYSDQHFSIDDEWDAGDIEIT